MSETTGCSKSQSGRLEGAKPPERNARTAVREEAERLRTPLTGLFQHPVKAAPPQRMLLNGNEALAWSAVLAQVGFFSHYPGSPVNQVEPSLKALSERYALPIKFNDSLNEHVALLAAAGASLCGARSLVVMKHVGLNIAADPANYLGMSGVKGGLTIVVGTDPGATCSTGEEDVHWYVPQCNFPLLEPVTIRDIVAVIPRAMELSEIYDVPVLVFLPAALCFNTDSVEIPAVPTDRAVTLYFERDRERHTHVGQRAVEHHKALLERIQCLRENSAICREHFNQAAEFGLVTRGSAQNYCFEAVMELGLEAEVHQLNFDLVYPLNPAVVKAFFEGKKEVLVVEDQDGFLEQQLKTLLYNDSACPIRGKEFFPSWGDLQYAEVYNHLARRFDRPEWTVRFPDDALDVPERLGTYCEGCPHRASFYGIEAGKAGTDRIVGGDIGCSSLPPHQPDWLLCMNAGIGLSQGMAQVLPQQSVISTGGDGSFFHMGIVSLHNAVVNGLDLLHVILDNGIVAMTGHQPSATTRSDHRSVDIRRLVEALGVDHCFEANAFLPFDVRYKIQKAEKLSGVRVVWIRGDCALLPSEETKKLRRTRMLQIHNDRCNGCTECYQELGCPAINRVSPQSRDIGVDLNRCMRCGVCLEVCPNDAIEVWYE